MEKQRTGQLLSFAALIVAVVGLSVGFAAFSNTLVIKSSANVTPDSSTFNVDFSSSSTEVAVDEIVPTLVASDSQKDKVSSTNAIIDNSTNPTISNLGVTFTEPGQSATYKFYAYNAGELKAYLKSITYANANGGNAPKVCTAKTGTTDELVQKACNAISLKVDVGAQSATGSVADITTHGLEKMTSELVTVTIEYAVDGERADGDFTVVFGDVTLKYSSAD